MVPRLTSLLRPLAVLSVGGAIFLLVLTWADSAGSGAGATADAIPRVVAYVGAGTDIDGPVARRLTHVNYASAEVTDSLSVAFRSEQAAADLARLQALKGRNADLKLLASIDATGAPVNPDASLPERARKAIAEGAVDLVTRYNLDGVDIDGAFAGRPGAGPSRPDTDPDAFLLLLRDLRERLDSLSEAHERTGADRYLLTVAAGGTRTYIEAANVGTAHRHLDFINVTTYDFFDRKSSTTGYHAGLYRSSAPGASSLTASAAVERYLEAGVPARKVVMGVAFYGKGWTGVMASNHGLFQIYDRFTRTYPYDLLERRYVNQRGFDRYWDPSAKAPYLWNEESRTFISYEDPASLRNKASFIRERGLGGVTYWRHAYDPDRDLLSVLFSALRPAGS